MSKNDVVIVELDRPRELRFGHKALKKLNALTGKEVDELGSDELDFDMIEQIFFYGLQRDARENGEALTLEQMEDILDCAESYEYLMEKMNEAFRKAFGAQEGNEQLPGKKASTKPKGNRSTGKKA